jgi:antirestriction protein ArdC
MTSQTLTGPYQRIYDDINYKVMAALKHGDIPWRKPWAGHATALPLNLVSRRRYCGWNLFYLSWMKQENNYPSPHFVTFLQARQLGGSILKGSKGFPIIKWVEKKATPDHDCDPDETPKERRFFPVIHVVFNVAQTEGVDYPQSHPVLLPAKPIDAAENLLSKMQQLPPIEADSDRAAYRPASDRILMPPKGDFYPPEEYYSPLFHEIIHSTGHTSRLNRSEIMGAHGFGSTEYSREELTAEFGAAYLCGISGIEQQTAVNSAAYIREWMSKLCRDPALVYKACSKAQAAVDFLLPDPGGEQAERTEDQNGCFNGTTRPQPAVPYASKYHLP